VECATIPRTSSCARRRGWSVRNSTVFVAEFADDDAADLAAKKVSEHTGRTLTIAKRDGLDRPKKFGQKTGASFLQQKPAVYVVRHE
jgi:hypothetical protein